ncbi:MAG: gliding motility-associated C-terminal domain-containing protein, partial [Saprospiraceae bacterium]|nr:gliding motility-associated C-terminal domain-containing protein [Saprospiraceae bacterium]
NGDGSNDYLFFDGLGRFRRSQLRVYNQDGVLVYQDLEYKNDWQGTGKQSDPLPEGIYFYTLLLDYQEQVLKIDSDLTILRD